MVFRVFGGPNYVKDEIEFEVVLVLLTRGTGYRGLLAVTREISGTSHRVSTPQDPLVDRVLI